MSPLRSKREQDWRKLESGGGRHELPDSEPPAPPGMLWFFDDEGGYFTSTVEALKGAS
jgi:hypothetical protein